MTITNNGHLFFSKITQDMDTKLGYWCQVRNTVTNKTFLSRSAGRVKITHTSSSSLSPTITYTNDVTYVRSGDVVKVFCAAQGNPAPQYSWTHGSQTIGSEPVLKIEDTKKPGDLVYTCNVRNKFGKDAMKVKIVITGEWLDCSP